MTDTSSNAEDDIRPVVSTFSSIDRGAWIFGGVLLIGAIALFSALSANREAAQTHSVLVPDNAASSGRIASPPPLALGSTNRRPPVRLQRTSQPFSRPSPIAPAPLRLSTPAAPSVAPPVSSPPPAPALGPRENFTPRSEAPLVLPEPPLPPPPVPSVVYQAPTDSPASASNTNDTTERVLAGRFENPALTVPQGTVIPAVLETALDSTRAGAVRALVQRDVYGFDGTRVLVHRGSRLYGEYEADLASGQNRALVRWTRLIRPDGVTISLDSPASDPLGRAGIKGKVDGKFFQRFGNALLQSALDIGVGVAVREASEGVVVALPGSTQNIQTQRSQEVQPTLKVKHGTSVSVFVARDLDFSSVDL